MLNGVVGLIKTSPRAVGRDDTSYSLSEKTDNSEHTGSI